MNDIVKRLREIFDVVDAELGGDISNVISEAADTIEMITAPDVDYKNFWHCLDDRFQEHIDVGAYIYMDQGIYNLHNEDGDEIAYGKSILELLVNLVLSE